MSSPPSTPREGELSARLSRLPRVLYVAGLVAVVSVMALGIWIQHRGLGRLLNDARVVNVAGRQRMLCERMLGRSLLLVDTPAQGRTRLHEELEAAHVRWRGAHARFLSGEGLPDGLLEDPEVAETLAVLQPAFLAMDERVTTLLVRGDASTMDALKEAAPRFVERMDAMVDALEHAARRRVAEMRQLLLGMSGVLLAVIFLQGGFVLAASVRVIGGHVRALSGEAERARRASESKSTYVATASHEIRTPMNGILGTLRLLEGHELPPKARELADIALKSAESLLSVLNDILDLSKLEAGSMVVERSVLSPVQLVRDVASVFRSSLQDGEVELLVDVAAEVPDWVGGDPLRVRQIVTNLVGNALKFTARGFVATRVRVEQGRLVFEVEDSGIGIPNDRLERVFEPFAQAGSDTSRRFGGTGLGLSISRQLATLMGGQLSVRSTLEAGSTFRLELPLEPVSSHPFEGAGVEQSREEAWREVAREVLADRNVLLVDDLVEHGELLGRQLAQWGMRHRSAGTAMDALERLAEERFDVVITDLRLPEIDGLELARHIQDRFGERAPPIILLSAFVERDKLGAKLARRFSSVLDKPCYSEQLAGALLRALGAPEARASEAAAPTRPPRVLVVDDNAINRLVARGHLEALGAEVEEAHDGVEAVERLAVEHGFDLVLMDVLMPKLDGVGATEQIRALELERSLAPVPIVALTANALPTDAARCRAAGMDDFLSKPFRAEDLSKLVGRWSGSRTASA